MGKKNIGVFFNCSEERFQKKFCYSLSKAARKLDYNLIFFMTFEVIDDESDFNKMNEKMIEFAPIEYLDAIIVAFDTYDRPSIRHTLEEELKKRATCPVISFREKHNEFYSITSNANDAMEKLINHLADYHHCTKIAFMAGYDKHYDSNERLKIYMDTMQKKGLKIYDNYVYHGDMWRFKGEEAFSYFFSEPEHIPEAVICANDYMARALCNAAEDHGLDIPADLIITGVDDIEEAVEYHPTLTTISVDIESMTMRTMELTDKLIKKQYIKSVNMVPAKIMYRESCGCNGEEDIVPYREQLKLYYEKTSHLLGQPHNQTMFQIGLDGCNSLEELLDTISRNIDVVIKHKSLYVYLSGRDNENGGRTFKENITDEVEQAFGYSDGERLPRKTKKISTDTAEFLDEFASDKARTIYISLLHDSNNCLGLVASEFISLNDTVNQYYFDYLLKISLALNKHYMASELKCLLEQSKQKSLTDFMTKLSNRRGFDYFVSQNINNWIKSGEEIAFMTLDLDGLKKVNDELGHEAGDLAISVSAKIIKKKCPEDGLCARIGGDEFLMVFPSGKILPDEIAIKIENSMRKRNASGAFPFKLSVSIGWFRSVLDKHTRVEDCISESDQRMYEMKKKHHSEEWFIVQQ